VDGGATIISPSPKINLNKKRVSIKFKGKNLSEV
jgi:hypothetical protein